MNFQENRALARQSLEGGGVNVNDFPIVRAIKQHSFKPFYEDYMTQAGRQKLMGNFSNAMSPSQLMPIGKTKAFKIDGRSVPYIMGKMDRVDDTNVMKGFVDYVRTKMPENVNLEINARRMGDAMGLNTDVANSALANKYGKFLDYMRSIRKQ